MKITIAYRPEEERDAEKTLALLLQRYPRGKVRKSDRYPPVKHLYLTVKEPLKKPEDLEPRGIEQNLGSGGAENGTKSG